ncbi:MAG: hypothetical protein JXR48_13850 [Candidatus Delongbacteria bacterium]|nr:hypothetical protein [Candidatus Delongbacteria bacterium]MBN2836039.1 hypothetical protein [Candidatus Delongbacteria bacterium]
MDKTEVIIIGTFHGNHINMVNYHFGTLEYLITLVNPDILALEIRPNDLKAQKYNNCPKDISDIVIPWAIKNEIPFYGIDYWKRFDRFRHNRFHNKLLKSETGKEKLKKVLNEIQIHSDVFQNFEDFTVDYIHSEEFSKKDYLVRRNHTDLFGEGPGNLFWYTRAEKMNELLDNVINNNKNKRIVVITGASHRGDFEKFLESREDINILSIRDLINIKNLPTYESYIQTLDKDKLEDTIFLLVQGLKANSNPDDVNTDIIKRLLSIYEGMENPVYLDYFFAEYFYLIKEYEKSLSYFINSRTCFKLEKKLGLKMIYLADLRTANILDLLCKREDAIKIYKSYSKKLNRISLIAKYYLKNQFRRLKNSKE